MSKRGSSRGSLKKLSMSNNSVVKSLKSMSKSSENVVILVLLVILVILVVYYIRQNNEGFSERPTVYFFYVDWCPHCKTAKPKVQEFKSKNSHVNVKEVNCEKDKELARKFNVRAYPTVYLVKGEEKTELNEGISVNSLNNLVKNN
jgi:thiol-disulfide isomerase/thioredoxin